MNLSGSPLNLDALLWHCGLLVSFRVLSKLDRMRRPEMLRTCFTHPLVRCGAIFYLCRRGMLGAKAEIDLDDNHVGVLRGVPTHLWTRARSSEWILLCARDRNIVEAFRTVVERRLLRSYSSSDMTSSMGTFN